jgi:hypothetical protein
VLFDVLESWWQGLTDTCKKAEYIIRPPKHKITKAHQAFSVSYFIGDLVAKTSNNRSE